jgi:hypothetical protein
VIADQTGNAAKEQMKRSLALAMFFLNPLA